jgi:hypothetical protein
MQISSEVTDKKFQAICNEIERINATVGKVRLVLVMRHYPSFDSAEDLYDDLRFVKLYADYIDKVSVLCDKSWKRTYFGIFSLFSNIQMKFFDISEYNEAYDWIQANQVKSVP